jgi:hypothetical protein
MLRTDFINEIMPLQFKVQQTTVADGPDSLRVYKGTTNQKWKDINFIKGVAREKVEKNGAPVLYFPINPDSNNPSLQMTFDNTLKDHTHLELGPPISMIATWTPLEYQLDLSKWGVMMPMGSDQQLFFHVDELTEKLKRKPLIGDIIETINDRTRYRVSDVYYGNINLWENIFCMVSLSKATYDTYTSQLDQYDEEYKDTYTKLEEVLDVMDGSTHNATNAEIQKEKKRTDNPKQPKKRSLDTGLDIMTMKL